VKPRIHYPAALIDGRPEGNPVGQTDVAVRDGQVIGFVRYGTRTGEPGRYVFGLYVHPARAGHGTGRSLLSPAEQRLREQGSDTVSLHVFEANERARRLYAEAGCTPESSPYAAAGGWARLADTDFPEAVPADAETLFDLASLTKVVATLPLVLLLHQRGQWSIDDPVARWLPGAPRSPVTISQCLLHVAGLVPHRPYYETCAWCGARCTTATPSRSAESAGTPD
jgi:hypothetical protein